MSSTHQALVRALEIQRVRAGITKAELASGAGMSPASLSKRLSGLIPIDTNEIDAFAKALNIDPFDLMDAARGERARDAA